MRLETEQKVEGGGVQTNRISVCIVCRNEADRLEPCLQSVLWADEVIVMDLSSTDGSGDLARQYGAEVIERDPVPIVEMVRNEIASRASGEWILVLDPDERVTPGLAGELEKVSLREDVDAVVVPRMNYDLGYPPSSPVNRYEPQLRMYRRSAVEWPTVPNALPEVPESRRHHVPSRDELVLIHDRSRNIPEVLDRVLRYAPIQAQSMIDRGQVFTARDMLGTIGSKIYKQFFIGKALKDGVPGLLRGWILVSFHVYVWACFWQLSGARRTEADDRFLGRLGLLLEVLRIASRVVGAPVKLLRRIVGK